MSHIKTLGAKWMTCSRLHTENPKISGATVQNLITQDFCTLLSHYKQLTTTGKKVELLSFSQIISIIQHSDRLSAVRFSQ